MIMRRGRYGNDKMVEVVALSNGSLLVAWVNGRGMLKRW